MRQRTLGLNFSFTDILATVQPPSPRRGPGPVFDDVSRPTASGIEGQVLATRYEDWRVRNLQIPHTLSSNILFFELHLGSRSRQTFYETTVQADQPSSQRSSGVLLLPECSFCPGIKGQKAPILLKLQGAWSQSVYVLIPRLTSVPNYFRL